MDKKNTGDASNSKGTVTTGVQGLMKEEAELKNQLETAKRLGEEQKAKAEDFDVKLVRMLNDDFEGIGYEDIKIYYDKLVEIKREIIDLHN